MKKIMFNDRCGLTNSVVLGQKTMTRRMLPKQVRKDSERCDKIFIRNNEIVLDFGVHGCERVCSLPYKVGEEVAIAQKYKDLPFNPFMGRGTTYTDAAGWENKMFVKAELMPNRLRMTAVKVERLLAISNEDCEKEGIWLDNSVTIDFPQAEDIHPYVFKVQGHKWFQPTPQIAYENLVRLTMGKKVLDANPWVLAYTFEYLED